MRIRTESGSKVIGYFAYNDFGEIFCSEDACIVAGSEELMREYFRKKKSSVDGVVIKKIRFVEIIDGMGEEVEYAFDREAYDRFLLLAKANDLLSDDRFLQEPATELDFIIVKLVGF